MTKYQNAQSTRRESRTIAGRFRGGKLTPVMAHGFRESEGGVLSQTITHELDPIAGRMITPVTAEVVCVYVPVQAIDALKNPTLDYAGNTEIIRDKLLSGSPLFDLENETEVSKRCGVVPQNIGTARKVNEAVRIAHNCAVNYLRRRKYVKATQLLAESTAITPALIAQTVLDRFNAVLDPEDRVNGAVDFAGKIPVEGIWTSGGFISTNTLKTTEGTAIENGIDVNSGVKVQEDPDNPGFPGVYANMNGGQGISLTDFYDAEMMDQLTREMRQIVDANPEYGEEMITRWAHGLSVDSGKQPFILYEKTVSLTQSYRQATDGPNLDVAQSDLMGVASFTVPIPKTELGGIVITFSTLKPDETLASQPHPFLSKEWSAINYVAEEMQRDPIPVTMRELDAEVDSADQATVAFYVGLNHIKKNYVNYGFNRHMDLNDVANKTALWQLEVPMSVTPDSILYPDDLDHYPFADQLAEVCTYTISSNATVQTPIIFGPTPVEELLQIETDDIFEDLN